MLAALRTLSSLPCSGKRIAVLGSMLELGEQQQELHRQMGRSINEFDVDQVICVGSAAKDIAHSCSNDIKVEWVSDFVKAASKIAHSATAEDLILLKASRSDRLERILCQFEPVTSLEC
jgi:UDP-N-acetylmuramoyl-tripeptide--D-alanyl-D-alanine ligase